jgi:hypothetical protein
MKPEVEAALANLTPVEKVSKDGTIYDLYTVGRIVVPEVFRGVFLKVDSLAQTLTFSKTRKLSDEQKKANKDARDKVHQEKYNKVIAGNVVTRQKRDSLNSELRDLKKQVKKSAVNGEDISSMQERLGAINVELITLKTNYVPKKWR